MNRVLYGIRDGVLNILIRLLRRLHRLPNASRRREAQELQQKEGGTPPCPILAGRLENMEREKSDIMLACLYRTYSNKPNKNLFFFAFIWIYLWKNEWINLCVCQVGFDFIYFHCFFWVKLIDLFFIGCLHCLLTVNFAWDVGPPRTWKCTGHARTSNLSVGWLGNFMELRWHMPNFPPCTSLWHHSRPS